MKVDLIQLRDRRSGKRVGTKDHVSERDGSESRWQVLEAAGSGGGKSPGTHAAVSKVKDLQHRACRVDCGEDGLELLRAQVARGEAS
jgi:hypothetical protein